MKTYLKSIAIILLPFLIISCSEDAQPVNNVKYETFVSQNWVITLHDTIIASAEWLNSSELAFKNGWRISEIFVHPGEQVKKWQIIARLWNNESDIRVNGLSNVAWWLMNIVSDTESMISESINMKKSIEQLYDERIAQAELWIKQLKNELIKNEKTLSDTVNDLDQTYNLQLNNLINLANASLHEWDKILGMTTNFEYSNDGWEDYLGTRAGSSRSDAENTWNKLYTTIGELKSIKEKKIILGSENTNLYIPILQKAYIDLRLYHEKMVFMLENSVVGAGLTIDYRDNWLRAFTQYKSNTSEIEWGFLNWKTQITSLLITNTGSKSTQELSLDSFRIQIENALKNKNILIAEKKSKINEININITEIRAKKSEISTKVSETKMNEFLAIESNKSDIIRAPYGWVILEKYMNIWTIVWAGMPVFRITSTDKTILKAYIDNALYVYKIGDVIKIESPINNRSYTGTITLLQNERDPIHNKNYIEINIPNTDIVIGERMIIELLRKKSPWKNGTIIPVNAIITKYWPPGVYIIQNNTVRFQLVEIISSDLSFAEVLWINDGIKIITNGKENMYDGLVL